jgi:hypothetical protein
MPPVRHLRLGCVAQTASIQNNRLNTARLCAKSWHMRTAACQPTHTCPIWSVYTHAIPNTHVHTPTAAVLHGWTTARHSEAHRCSMHSPQAATGGQVSTNAPSPQLCELQASTEVPGPAHSKRVEPAQDCKAHTGHVFAVFCLSACSTGAQGGSWEQVCDKQAGMAACLHSAEAHTGRVRDPDPKHKPQTPTPMVCSKTQPA